MTAMTSALRRRVAWALLAGLLAAATLTGCDDKDQPPAPTPATQAGIFPQTGSAPDDDAIAHELSQQITDWLAQFGNAGSQQLACPASNTVVVVTGIDSGPSSDVQACLVPAQNGGMVSLRIRNQTGVPITVWGSSTLFTWTVQPETTVGISLFGPKFGDVISFKPDLRAGATMALLDSLTDKVQPSLKWTDCAAQPEVQCLVGLAAEFLPERIRVGRWTLPANRIGEVLTTVWENEDLIKAYWAQAGNRDGGYLKLRQI